MNHKHRCIMLKNISRLEVVIADKIYHLTCDVDSPISHVKEALLKFIYYVGQVEEAVVAQQKAVEEQSEAEKPKSEEPPNEN